jgi:DNA-binding MarR family transcriptional regulator
MSTRSTHDQLAAAAWRLMVGQMRSNKHLFTGVAQEMGLTPGDLHALLSIDAGEARPMRAMAEEWRCDASNVTWMVDRLEAHGYVERQSKANDRRVRTVALTAAGVVAQERAKELLHQVPASFSKLTADDLRDLIDILGRLTDDSVDVDD